MGLITALFNPGEVVATTSLIHTLMEAGVLEEEISEVVIEHLERHLTGDWGNLDDEDKRTNEQALKLGNRILSCYEISGEKVYVITEWDRSQTTIMLASDY